MLTVKVLGGGCANCQRLEAEARAALASLDPEIPYELVKVTDAAEIAAYGVLGTPALVLDEQVKCAGRIPKRQEIVEWVMELLSSHAA